MKTVHTDMPINFASGFKDLFYYNMLLPGK